MTTENRKIPLNEAREELRQLARDLNFAMCQFAKKVEEVKLMLYGEAREIRRVYLSKDDAEPDVSRRKRHLRKGASVNSKVSR
jgi:hypothetical protein